MISSASSATSTAPKPSYRRASRVRPGPTARPRVAALRPGPGRRRRRDDPPRPRRDRGPHVASTPARRLRRDHARRRRHRRRARRGRRAPWDRRRARNAVPAGARRPGRLVPCSWPNDDSTAALIELRSAFNEYHALGVRYEAARTRLLIAAACEALGDHDAAAMETSAARAVLESLGATDAEHDRRASGHRCRRSHPARARGPRPARPGQDKPSDRSRALHQREDRRQPREPHLHQARRRIPIGRHRLRLRPPSRVSPQRGLRARSR